MLHRDLIFCTPSDSQLIKSTYTDLPRGSSLSPLFFNFYISVVTLALEATNVPHLIYANDIVIFNSHKDLSFAINFLNNSLVTLNNSLNSVHLSVFPTKFKVVIFTRKLLYDFPDFFLGYDQIPIVPKTTYLGLILDSDLR